MSDPIQVVKQVLVETAGGYLRNPVGPGVCARCFVPTVHLPLCPHCAQRSVRTDGPDALGFMTYAGHLEPIPQSGKIMRDYKSTWAGSAAAQRTVALMAALGLLGHRDCPAKIVGSPPTAWATVPSLPPTGAPHPLNAIVNRLSREHSQQIVLAAHPSPSNPRALDPNHYAVPAGISPATNVLLVDDTWTGGGHALSAVAALRAAGAAHVSLLVLARWLRLGWEATTQEWARQRLAGPDFNPNICPWTQGPCP